MSNSTPGTSLDVNGNINVGSILYDRANTNYYVNPSGNIMPYAANLGGNVGVPDPDSYRFGEPTNYVYTTNNYGISTVEGPAGLLQHDLLAFGVKVPFATLETYTSSWATDTAVNGIFADQGNTTYTIIDGATKTAALETFMSSP